MNSIPLVCRRVARSFCLRRNVSRSAAVLVANKDNNQPMQQTNRKTVRGVGLNYMNRVQLMGFVGNPPTVNENMAVFKLATATTYKDAQNIVQQSKPQFHPVVVFNQQLKDFVAKIVKKGIHVFVDGTIRTYFDTRDNLSKTVIHANSIHEIGKLNEEESSKLTAFEHSANQTSYFPKAQIQEEFANAGYDWENEQEQRVAGKKD